MRQLSALHLDTAGFRLLHRDRGSSLRLLGARWSWPDHDDRTREAVDAALGSPAAAASA